jgi:type II restriction/modification system DNA methylase subunit YeeA
MEETAIKYAVFVLFGIVGAIITFWIFGAELPTYLFLTLVGLLMYSYATNIAVKFAGGYIGRFFAVLFVISLLYYFGTKTFFPADPLNFRFLKVGIEFTIDFFIWSSNFIGKLVLSLIDIIIP